MNKSVAYSLHCKISFKVIVIGEQGVGKTSLIVRYIKDIFSKDYKVTVGFEFYSKVVKCQDEDINVQIWDTAGQQAFRAMIRSFYRNAACVFLMFSLDKPNTLQALYKWNEQVKEFSSPFIVKILIGTKSDLFEENQSTLNDKIQEFKKRNKIDLFMKVSSKNASNIQEVFQESTKIMYERYESNDYYRELVSPQKTSFLLPEPDKEESSSPSPKKKKKNKQDNCC